MNLCLRFMEVISIMNRLFLHEETDPPALADNWNKIWWQRCYSLLGKDKATKDDALFFWLRIVNVFDFRDLIAHPHGNLTPSAEIVLYKPKRPKGFFQFEKILNVLVSSFRFIWTPMVWVYGKICLLWKSIQPHNAVIEWNLHSLFRIERHNT